MSSPASTVEGPPYRVEYGDKEIVIRIPADLVTREEVCELLDRFVIESVRREFNFSEEEVLELAREMKRGSWERLRPMVEAKLRGG